MDMLADIDRVPAPGNSGGSLLVGWNGRVGFGVFECLGFLDSVYFSYVFGKKHKGMVVVDVDLRKLGCFFFHRFSLNTFLDVFWSDKIILVFREGFET